MISVTEAKQFIQQHTVKLTPVTLPLLEATGKILSSDVLSPVDLPPFHQSAMDGYAFSFDDWDKQSPLQIIGEVAAGNEFKTLLKPNCGVRIFTGAAIPQGADTVVMQEKVTPITTEGNGIYISLNDPDLKKGQNVRTKSSQTKKETLAMQAGIKLTPAAISYLASMGITEVQAIPHPRIGIIVTGNELLQPGTELTDGKIFESNSYSLLAALSEMRMKGTKKICGDTMELIASTVSETLNSCDVVLMTGGVSVGDYDFVIPALNHCGAEIIFHKIRQKPGKPMCFARLGNKLIFALPGNPASVLTCFYEYVVPALYGMSGHDHSSGVKAMLPMASDYSKKAGLTHFLKAGVSGGTVTPYTGQESYRMDTFSIADALIVLDEETTEVKAGDLVEVHFTERILNNS